MRYLATTVAIAAMAVASIGAQTAGWKVRADKSTSAADPDGAGAIKFTPIAGGFHAVNPQAAVYWHPNNTASGAYTLKGTFTLNEPSSHPNYYGLVFGGDLRRRRAELHLLRRRPERHVPREAPRR